MSNGDTGDGNPSTNERREAARAKAKALRVQHKKKDRARRYLLRGGLIIGSLAVITVVALVLINTVRPAGPGPLNMLSDGIKISQGLKAVPTGALAAEAEPVPSESDVETGVIDIQVYMDYYCALCDAFGETNDEQIESWLDRGAATIEVHPISILNPNSMGTQYSTRSANTAACVANYSPDTFWAVNKALFANQPEERTAGLSDDELVAIVTEAGVLRETTIENCIRDQRFKNWVQEATLRALDGTVPGTDVVVEGAPTIVVNGLKYEGAVDNASTFAAFVVQAAGAAFTESSTATPTPAPTTTAPAPTATPTPTRAP